jgi:NTP pyrophosphatase (non-canonical NTP hydrolase)
MYPEAIRPTIYLLGLMGELGEITNKFKKVFRDHGGTLPNRQVDYALELGDVMWYLTRFSNELGFSLQEIIEYNFEKLNSRYKRGKIHGSGDER